MYSHKDDCHRICNQVLKALNSEPPIWLPDSEYDRFSDKWKTVFIKNNWSLDNSQFREILAYLDGYVNTDGEYIEISIEGIKFINDGGHEMEYIPTEMEESESGLLVPKGYSNSPVKENEITFEGLMSEEQKSKLVKFLRDNEYVNKPDDLVDFLNGKHSGEGIVFTPKKLTEVAILLDFLNRSDLLKTSVGGWKEAIEMKIRPFSLTEQKGQKVQLKKHFRKSGNKGWDKSNKEAALEAFKAAFQILYLFNIIHRL